MSARGRFIISMLAALLLTPATVVGGDDAQHLKNGQTAEVVKIDKAHRVIAKLDSGKQVPVRVLGVNCPDTRKGYSNASKLLLHEKVTLESDKSFLPILKDQSGNFVAYVRLGDGGDYGEKMIATGACTDETWRLPHPRADRYKKARQHNG